MYTTTTLTRTHAVHVLLLEIHCSKSAATIQKEKLFGRVVQTIEILCFVFIRLCARFTCVVNLLKRKTWSLLVDWPLARSLAHAM